jgi:hypothetical protein
MNAQASYLRKNALELATAAATLPCCLTNNRCILTARHNLHLFAIIHDVDPRSITYVTACARRSEREPSMTFLCSTLIFCWVGGWWAWAV